MSTAEAPPQPTPTPSPAPEPTPEPTPPTPQGDAEKGELFDKSQYDSEELRLPKVDGEGVDRIAVKVNGTIFLDRSDPRDVELFRSMTLGRDITLMVEGRVSKKAHGFTTDREGELDVIKAENAINVHTVYRPVADE
jgi:hypothetical protein